MTKPNRHRALNVVCPKCRAPIGQPCRTLNRRAGPGRRKVVSMPHPARRHLARDQFVREKTLRAQVLPMVGGDKSDARKLAAAIVENESAAKSGPRPLPVRRGSLSQPKQAYLRKNPKVDPRSQHCPKCGADSGEECVNVSKSKKKSGKPIQGYHLERRVAAVVAWKEGRKGPYGDWLQEHGRRAQQERERVKELNKTTPEHHYRGTAETYEQVGVNPAEAGARGRSSTISQLCADEKITLDQLEVAAEICEAHRLLTGETIPRGMDPSAVGGGGGRRWVVNDVSTRELVLEETYRQFRDSLGEAPRGMPVIRDIVIFEVEWERVVARWEQMGCHIQTETLPDDPKPSPEIDLLRFLRSSFDIWNCLIDENWRPDNANKSLKKNDKFFDKHK